MVLIGQSGSGKSTLLRLFNRLDEPTTGEVHIQGERVPEQDVITLRRHIGYVQQDGFSRIGLLKEMSASFLLSLDGLLIDAGNKFRLCSISSDSIRYSMATDTRPSYLGVSDNASRLLAL